jgi:hypothetical protein
MRRREKGIVLVMVIILAVIITIIGFAVLTLAEQEIIQNRIDADKARAFYLAEAGLAKLQEKLQRPITGNLNEVLEGTLEQGRYRVEIDTNSTPCYAVSTGISGPIQKKIRVQVAFLAPPFEDAVYAMNSSGGSWAFQLRGTGNPVQKSGYGTQKGGKDEINGNISIDGDARFYEESRVNPAPAPNKWNLDGDVSATGSITTSGSASIAGSRTPNAEAPEPVDMEAMNYAVNNTYNVSQIFQDAHVTSGYLPSGNPLRDVFNKNPNRAECSSTPRDDYFFEPSSQFVTGTPFTGDTPLHAGDKRVYYVDGDVWISGQPTYGFKMDGKATIVATGDIHVCDNLQYNDPSKDMLALVALGKYDAAGKLVSGGNIYFGDAVYGNMYIFSAMMFAANNFLFNTDRITNKSAEPDTGFVINGSLAAMNKVQIERDWYTKSGTARPAHYNSATGAWVDSQTGAALTATELGSIRHYQMIVNYDDRVRSPETRPPGLPRGNGTKIFSGFSNWEEL